MRTGMCRATYLQLAVKVFAQARMAQQMRKEKGRHGYPQRPFLEPKLKFVSAYHWPELNWRYFSLPTNPNLLTPDTLMMCSTLAVRS